MQDTQNWCASSASASEALHRAAARVDSRLDQRLTEIGLTSRQFLLLKSVAAHDGITQVGLSEISGIDRSTMTDMVGRLVNRGLLAREKKMTDARAYNVRITEVGRTQLAAAMPVVNEVDAALLEKIPPHLRETFLQTIIELCEQQ